MTQIVEVPGFGQVEFPDGMSDADIGLAIRKNMLQKPEPKAAPSDLAVINNAGWKGLASIPDAILNTPNNLMNLGKAAVGQIPLAMDRPDLAPRPTPNPDYVQNFLRNRGLITPEAEPVTPGQRVMDAATQGAASALVNPARSVPQMVTGIAAGAAGGGVGRAVADETDSPTAGAVAGMAVPFGVQAAGAAGRARMADAALNQSRNAVRDQTLTAGQQEGYVVPPSVVNPSAANKVMESLAGKAAIKQDASLRNQAVTNDLAAKELGLPAGTPITPGLLDSYRKQVSAPYQQLAGLSTRAEAMLFQLREARNSAQQFYKFYDRSADPNALNNAKYQENKAKMLEAGLDREASRLGRPDLVPQMKEARTQIAKSYDIEKALNEGDASVRASKLGASVDQGKPLTGGLKTAGDFALAFRPYVQEAATVPTPGVSKLGAYGAGMLGAGGASIAGPVGAAAAALPLLSGPVRSLLLSQAYQRNFAQPNYSQGSMLGQIPQMDPMLQSLLLGNQLSQ